MTDMSHRDGDPDKTKEEYDNDNHADQENPNNDEYDKDALQTPIPSAIRPAKLTE